MGIIKTASDDFEAAFTAFKLTNPTRDQKRKYVAAFVDRANEWLSKFDAQERTMAAEFAASKAAQFTAFKDTVSDPALTTLNAAD